MNAVECELLADAAEALWACSKAALTVKPTLDVPYPEAPAWTPYTRWVELPAREAHDLCMKIRKHLRSAPGGMSDSLADLPEADPAYLRGLADGWTQERERIARRARIIGANFAEYPAMAALLKFADMLLDGRPL